MAEFDNTNTGILSKNDRKEKDTHPDHKGQINVNGVEYWLSAWIKNRRDGSGKFFSLSITPKDAQPQQRSAPQQQRQAPALNMRDASGFDSMDSDIPF